MSTQESLIAKTSFCSNEQIIEGLAQVLKKYNLTEIEYQDDALKIKMVRGQRVEKFREPLDEEPSRKDSVPQNEVWHVVSSPMIGVAYLTSKPEGPTLIKLGDHVQEGQILLIIESMKVMNPIKSPLSGIVKKIAIKNGTPVEYGEELISIEVC